MSVVNTNDIEKTVLALLPGTWITNLRDFCKHADIKVKDFNTFSESTVIEAIEVYDKLIDHITHPTPNMIICAMTNHGLYVLDRITKRNITLSDEVIRAALKFHASAVLYVGELSEELRLLAVTENPAAMLYMTTQPMEFKHKAIMANPNAIQYMAQTEELAYIAVCNGAHIRVIEKPTCEMKYIAALRGDYES